MNLIFRDGTRYHLNDITKLSKHIVSPVQATMRQLLS